MFSKSNKVLPSALTLDPFGPNKKIKLKILLNYSKNKIFIKKEKKNLKIKFIY